MLPDDLFINLIDLDLQKRISAAEDLDHDATEALKTLLNSGPDPISSSLNDWTIEDFDRQNILFYKGKNYIPKDQSLRQHIVRTHHDHETAEHPGELETYNAV